MGARNKTQKRNIDLRKSHLRITRKKIDAYTIFELFSKIDMRRYFDDSFVQRAVVSFVKDKTIKNKAVFTLMGVFPSKATRNIMESGIIDEFT